MTNSPRFGAIVREHRKNPPTLRIWGYRNIRLAAEKNRTENRFGGTLFPCRSWVKEPLEAALSDSEGAFAVVGPQGALI
jgi:hypothetical protein